MIRQSYVTLGGKGQEGHLFFRGWSLNCVIVYLAFFTLTDLNEYASDADGLLGLCASGHMRERIRLYAKLFVRTQPALAVGNVED